MFRRYRAENWTGILYRLLNIIGFSKRIGRIIAAISKLGLMSASAAAFEFEAAVTASFRQEVKIPHFYHKRVTPSRRQIRRLANILIQKIMGFYIPARIDDQTAMPVIKERAGIGGIQLVRIGNGAKWDGIGYNNAFFGSFARLNNTVDQASDIGII